MSTTGSLSWRHPNQAKHIPSDLADLWSEVLRLAVESPVGCPFGHWTLVMSRNTNATTIRMGSAPVTGQESLDPYRIPLPPFSAVRSSGPAILVVKD